MVWESRQTIFEKIHGETLMPRSHGETGPMIRMLPHGIDTTNPRRMHLRGFRVVPPRIELGTQGFSVLCSTNWAMAPFFSLLEVRWSTVLFVWDYKGRHFFLHSKFFLHFFQYFFEVFSRIYNNSLSLRELLKNTFFSIFRSSPDSDMQPPNHIKYY